MNTPVAATGAWSVVATIARSGAPDGLMPLASPPASNPDAAVTLMLARSRCYAPGRSGPGSLAAQGTCAAIAPLMA